MNHSATRATRFAATIILLTAPPSVWAQKFIVPRDGLFYIAPKPQFDFKATLADNWENTHCRSGTLHLFAPVPPTLPSQTITSTRLFISGQDGRPAEEVVEASLKRPMLALHITADEHAITADEHAPPARIGLRAEYQGILFARTLQRGLPPTSIPGLTQEEIRQYLKSSVTMDHDHPELRRWMHDQGLKRMEDEETMQFAHRVFLHFIRNGEYGGDTSSYESRRPSQVCKSLTNDCGGLALLYVAVMRANNIPARTLFGRWAIPQTDGYGQYHVMAEFFVDQSGWVPVDVSGTLVHKPEDPQTFFGNSDGQFLTFHVDTDLEPADGFHHAWAQYLLFQWSGPGDFWKEHRFDSHWDVTRSPVKE